MPSARNPPGQGGDRVASCLSPSVLPPRLNPNTVSRHRKLWPCAVFGRQPLKRVRPTHRRRRGRAASCRLPTGGGPIQPMHDGLDGSSPGGVLRRRSAKESSSAPGPTRRRACSGSLQTSNALPELAPAPRAARSGPRGCRPRSAAPAASAGGLDPGQRRGLRDVEDRHRPEEDPLLAAVLAAVVKLVDGDRRQDLDRALARRVPLLARSRADGASGCRTSSRGPAWRYRSRAPARRRLTGRSPCRGSRSLQAVVPERRVLLTYRQSLVSFFDNIDYR
jgi:hypothetical protein